MNSPPQQGPSVPRISRARLRARYARILLYFGRVAIEVVIWDLVLRRIGFRRLARRTAPERYRRVAQRYRALASQLGGVWIKVGQFLSARVDVLPEAITAELTELQDEVRPEPFASMQAVAMSSFGVPIETRFASIEEEPLASASLGQVHRARMRSGESVVVKIQRPSIEDIVHIDLTALGTVIGWLKRYKPITRRADLDALMREFSSTLWQELDYLAEAEHARRIAEMFSNDPEVRIPVVYPQLTTKQVLTLEDVYFIKITDYDAIEAAGVDLSEVASRLLSKYLRQIFIEGFFHADPHPGNLFVEPLDDGDWRLVFVDFGMVGQLTPQAKDGLRNLAIALGTQDVDRLMVAYKELGVLLPEADIDRIRQAEGEIFEFIWGKSVRELVKTHPSEVRRLMKEYRDVIYEMPFQVPSDLIFLGRCVAILSGMCTGLDPDFNLFKHLVPFAEDLLSEEGGDWLDMALDWLTQQGGSLLQLPGRLDRALTRIESGKLSVITRPSPELGRRLDRLARATNRLVGAVIFAALLLVGTFLYTRGEQALGGALLGLAILSLAWIIRP